MGTVLSNKLTTTTTTMKFIIALCLFSCALAAPQDSQANVLRMDSDQGPDQAQFRYGYETSNRITEEREGYTGNQGQSNMRGTFSFPLADGSVAEFTYTADENGYRVQSPLLPPLPEFVQAQIRFAEEQRARGVVFE